jgi:15-cis-phytoene desaturase
VGEKVVILGAGVAGLTAAHELSKRGFDVEVYERRNIVGGKARSFRSDHGCPAEHGFRFFPGFYQHLHATMKDIPYDGQKNGVLDNLKETRDIQVLQASRKPVDLPTRLWRWDAVFLHSIRLGARHVFVASFGLSRRDLFHLSGRLFRLLAACPERRFADYETQSWLDFSGAKKIGGRYLKMVRALTRSLVAAHADELSARTGGYILLQLQLAVLRPKGHVPQVLNGPTSTVWLDPWRDYLESCNVKFHLQREVKEIRFAGGQIQKVVVADEHDVKRDVQADWYVSALPFEIMRDFVTPEMIQADQRLAGLRQLEYRWMNGIMFYLRRDVPLVDGHTIYIDSPWALTSISQRQFWKISDLGSVDGEKVAGILSVDVSDWDTAGEFCVKKAAKACTKAEIIAEVKAQLQEHLRHTGEQNPFRDDNILDVYLDDDISQPNPTREAINAEPLLINTRGSWANRPQACTTIKNLFLASDYVRTYTDLATMEAANEAARRAVNGILRSSHSTEPQCDLWPLEYPGGLFTWLRYLDRAQLRRKGAQAFAAAADLIAELDGYLPGVGWPSGRDAGPAGEDD